MNSEQTTASRRTIRTLRPDSKDGITMPLAHYNQLKELILTNLAEERQASLCTLINEASLYVSDIPRDVVGWLLMHVKLDMEAKGELVQQLRRKCEPIISVATKAKRNTGRLNDWQNGTNLRYRFKDLFRKDPLLINAPGRINIIGEHVDYNNGWVMPAAIDKSIQFALAKSDGEASMTYSMRYNSAFTFNQKNPERTKKPNWANYLLGVLQRLKELNIQIGPFSCAFDGNLPMGAGLSSSAALECGFVFGLNQLFELGLSRHEMLSIAHWSETNFVGVKCGIMDQFSSMLGRKDHLILLDCRSLDYRYLPFDFSKYQVVLCDTNVKHKLAATDYNTRREECHESIGILKKKYPEIQSLRDVTKKQLLSVRRALGETLFRRCSFVVSEIDRVKKAADDLEQGHLLSLGDKMYQSHRGLSRLYEVSCDQLDFLVKQGHELGAVGSRMMGGGFGGCTINLVESDHVGEFLSAAGRRYKRKFGLEMGSYTVKPSAGVELIA